MLNIGKTAHTYPIFKRLNTLKLIQMKYLELYRMGFKICKKQLPAPILSLFNSIGAYQSGKKGTNIIHIKNLPNILPHTSFAFNNSSMCKTTSQFMLFSSEVQRLTSLSIFPTKTKSMPMG